MRLPVTYISVIGGVGDNGGLVDEKRFPSTEQCQGGMPKAVMVSLKSNELFRGQESRGSSVMDYVGTNNALPPVRLHRGNNNSTLLLILMHQQRLASALFFFSVMFGVGSTVAWAQGTVVARTAAPIASTVSTSVASTTQSFQTVSRETYHDAAATLPPLWTSNGEHPLDPVLRWAKDGMPTVEKLKDYSATLVRRERIHGELSGYEYMFIKVRNTPFSVYVRFDAPTSAKGQEVIYVTGENHGNMLAHNARMRVPMALPPSGVIGMSGRHYPLTEIGIVNLVRRLVEVGEHDRKYAECEVKYFQNAKVDKRPCTVIQVAHPSPRDAFTFHLARIFVDDELKLPTRYESYRWPSEIGGDPELFEEYTYLNLKLNNGFTDADFSIKNPEYQYKQPSDVNNRGN